MRKYTVILTCGTRFVVEAISYFAAKWAAIHDHQVSRDQISLVL